VHSSRGQVITSSLSLFEMRAKFGFFKRLKIVTFFTVYALYNGSSNKHKPTFPLMSDFDL
jgi:hypothetical protein